MHVEDFLQRSRHGTVFYFRRRVPIAFRGLLGRHHIYLSLRTQTLTEARLRARLLAVLTGPLLIFSAAREKQNL
jgi:hypothetical protein